VAVGAGYLFNSAKVKEFAANPALVGLYLPQVPKHRGSVNVSVLESARHHGVAGRVLLRPQFDDDLNQRTKPGETEPGCPPTAPWS
jgi:hypothetical protein